MTRFDEPTKPEPSEKPTYETPIIVDLNQVQRGDGGILPDCTSGSGAFTCDSGGGAEIIP